METSILYPHISLNVRSIDASVAFYTAFFGAEPLKVRPGYAKFELQDPKLNFAINEMPASEYSEGAVNTLNHLGFQVASTDDVLMLKLRLKKAGLATQDEMQTTCCYSVQDKIWVEDPNGIHWEVFTVLSDAADYRDASAGANSVCCSPEVVTLKTAIQ